MLRACRLFTKFSVVRVDVFSGAGFRLVQSDVERVWWYQRPGDVYEYHADGGADGLATRDQGTVLYVLYAMHERAIRDTRDARY